MTKVVITLENRDAATELLNRVKDLKSIKGFDVTDDAEELSQQTIDFLDKRWAEHLKNPENTMSLEQFETSLRKKHDQQATKNKKRILR